MMNSLLLNTFSSNTPNPRQEYFSDVFSGDKEKLSNKLFSRSFLSILRSLVQLKKMEKNSGQISDW